jgi:eukaryotic-like serine/threonine-protein kinase
VASQESQRFGKYQILERIAAGGMAEIFKARLDGIGGFSRTFAIKRILPHLTQNPEFVDMLVEEAKIAGLLSHANIVQILDLGTVDDHYFIAMEYVNGRDLARVLARTREKGITLPVPHAVFVVIEMLKALDYAHNRQVLRGGRTVPLNIVHRDISPANVLVSFQGEVKLTDFGIAKASIKALETNSGVIKGRYDYMSPEQARGDAVDQRSDLYSVGVVLYELLTGRHPFRQRSEGATVDAIRRGQFDLPSDVNPDVPPSLDEVVSRALAIEPSDRFINAAALKESLDRFFHDSGFIFSASTLAAFVRGLFPESDPKARPKPATEDDTRLLEELDLDDEDPVPDAPSLTPRPLLPTAAATPVSTQAVPAGFGEASTVIRPEQPTRPGLVNEWAEAETVIRPGGDARNPEIAERPTVSSTPQLPAPAPPPPREASRSRVVYRTGTQVHLAYLALAFTTLVAGFAFGLLAGSAGSKRAPTVSRADPTVEVIVPVNAVVTLDGVPLTGPSPRRSRLQPKKPSRLHVEVPGAQPLETELNLDYDQTRVLEFTTLPLSEKK